MELQPKTTACLIYFLEPITTHILVQDAEEWPFTAKKGFDRAIHNIENAPFRTKFDKDMQEMKGNLGIGCISDYEPQPLIVRSHHGTYAITTVSKINNANEIVEKLFSNGNTHFLEMSGGDVNPTELVASIINQKRKFNRRHSLRIGID